MDFESKEEGKEENGRNVVRCAQSDEGAADLPATLAQSSIWNCRF